MASKLGIWGKVISWIIKHSFEKRFIHENTTAFILSIPMVFFKFLHLDFRYHHEWIVFNYTSVQQDLNVCHENDCTNWRLLGKEWYSSRVLYLIYNWGSITTHDIDVLILCRRTMACSKNFDCHASRFLPDSTCTKSPHSITFFLSQIAQCKRGSFLTLKHHTKHCLLTCRKVHWLIVHDMLEDFVSWRHLTRFCHVNWIFAALI